MITIYAFIVLFHLYKKNYLIINLEITIGMTIIAVLYNPIDPFYFSRENWHPINWVTSGIFFWYYNEFKEFE